MMNKQSTIGLTALALFLLWSSAEAQVRGIGPAPPPEDKPRVETNIPGAEKLKDAFSRFFGDSQGDTAEDGADAAASGEAAAPVEAAPMQTAPARPPLLAQPPLTNAKIEEPAMDEEDPPKIERVQINDPNNPLGLADAGKQLREVDRLIESGKLVHARMKLEPLKQWLIDVTEAHIGLYKVLNKLPSARAQAELEKQLALEFAILRDHAMYEMGKLYVKEDELRKAVKELTEVVKSQPKSKLGLQAYELLQEIGFTEKLQLAR